MTGNDAWFEQSGDELRDDEFPDDGDFGDGAFEDDDFEDDLSETVPCPQCNAEIYEDAVRCPNCGAYVTLGTSVWSGRPRWWTALGLLGIVVLILALLLSAY